MRSRSDAGSAPPRHLALALEQLGVEGALRDALCRRLSALTTTPSEPLLRAALAGVAAAQELRRADEAALRRSARDLQEIQRLLAAFADEIAKLDEALRILSAYVQRMRMRVHPLERRRILH